MASWLPVIIHTNASMDLFISFILSPPVFTSHCCRLVSDVEGTDPTVKFSSWDSRQICHFDQCSPLEFQLECP
jgi:hypothetical protein